MHEAYDAGNVYRVCIHLSILFNPKSRYLPEYNIYYAIKLWHHHTLLASALSNILRQLFDVRKKQLFRKILLFVLRWTFMIFRYEQNLLLLIIIFYLL